MQFCLSTQLVLQICYIFFQICTLSVQLLFQQIVSYVRMCFDIRSRFILNLLHNYSHIKLIMIQSIFQFLYSISFILEQFRVIHLQFNYLILAILCYLSHYTGKIRLSIFTYHITILFPEYVF
jgi:hypothetical protein